MSKLDDEYVVQAIVDPKPVETTSKRNLKEDAGRIYEREDDITFEMTPPIDPRTEKERETFDAVDIAVSKKDVQALFSFVLKLPLHKGDYKRMQDIECLDDIRDGNVPVQVKLIGRAATEALNGNHKWADFIMKYGGFTPVIQQTVDVTLPTFVDDIPPRNVTPTQSEIEQASMNLLTREPSSENQIQTTVRLLRNQSDEHL